MKKMCPLLLLAALNPLFLTSQPEQLLNDPDVIWAAKIELDWIPEPEWAYPYLIGDTDTSLANTSTVLKILHQGPHPADLGHDLLGWKIFDAVERGLLPVYESPASAKPLTLNEVRTKTLLCCDTVVTFDPETYEERVFSIPRSFDAEKLKFVRVQQWLFFRKSTGEFDVYSAAWQPVFDRNFIDKEGNFHYGYAPFWVKMPPYRRKKTPKLDLGSRHVTWARRLKAVNNGVRLDSLQAAKDFAPPVMDRFLDVVRKDPKFVLHSGADWAVIENPDRARLLQTRQDTFEIFDPETYESKQAFAETTYDHRNIPELRLMQDWWWDEREHQLQFRLFAFAPALLIEDFHRYYRYPTATRPLFWRECSRGKKQSQKKSASPLATYQPVRIFVP